jgi:hypothetical protein
MFGEAHTCDIFMEKCAIIRRMYGEAHTQRNHGEAHARTHTPRMHGEARTHTHTNTRTHAHTRARVLQMYEEAHTCNRFMERCANIRRMYEEAYTHTHTHNAA